MANIELNKLTDSTIENFMIQTSYNGELTFVIKTVKDKLMLLIILLKELSKKSGKHQDNVSSIHDTRHQPSMQAADNIDQGINSIPETENKLYPEFSEIHGTNHDSMSIASNTQEVESYANTCANNSQGYFSFGIDIVKNIPSNGLGLIKSISNNGVGLIQSMKNNGIALVGSNQIVQTVKSNGMDIYYANFIRTTLNDLRATVLKLQNDLIPLNKFIGDLQQLAQLVKKKIEEIKPEYKYDVNQILTNLWESFERYSNYSYGNNLNNNINAKINSIEILKEFDESNWNSSNIISPPDGLQYQKNKGLIIIYAITIIEIVVKRCMCLKDDDSMQPQIDSMLPVINQILFILHSADD